MKKFFIVVLVSFCVQGQAVEGCAKSLSTSEKILSFTRLHGQDRKIINEAFPEIHELRRPFLWMIFEYIYLHGDQDGLINIGVVRDQALSINPRTTQLYLHDAIKEGYLISTFDREDARRRNVSLSVVTRERMKQALALMLESFLKSGLSSKAIESSLRL